MCVNAILRRRIPLTLAALIAAACASDGNSAAADTLVEEQDASRLALPDGGRVEIAAVLHDGWPDLGSLRRLGRDGKVVWSLPELVSREALEERKRPPWAGAFFFGPDSHCIGGDRAALAATGKRLFVVQWASGACGAYAFGLDLDTGAIAWEHPVVGVGPCVHSRYHNDVVLLVVDGNLHVLGDEGAGRYCEVIAADGRRLSTTLR